MRCALAIQSLMLFAVSARGDDIRVQDLIQETDATGTVVQDPTAPVSFKIPPGWKLDAGMRWGDHETTLYFRSAEMPNRVALYYQLPAPKSPLVPDVEAALRKGVDNKVALRHAGGFTDYRVRPASIHRLDVGGFPAIRFVADFTSQNHEPTIEYMVRVIGDKSKAHLFAMMPAAEDVDAFERSLQPALQSLRIP